MKLPFMICLPTRCKIIHIQESLAAFVVPAGAPKKHVWTYLYFVLHTFLGILSHFFLYLVLHDFFGTLWQTFSGTSS